MAKQGIRRRLPSNRRSDAAAPRDPLALQSDSVGSVFRRITREIDQALEGSGQQSPVDLELTFKAVTLNQKGVPLFSKKVSESTMEIRLATRILPREE